MRKQQTSRSALSKQQLINEYRSRLRQSTRAFSDHITKIAHAAKIPTEESALKASSTALVSEHYTLVNELSTRAALMARAADEILKLTNDIREFLILRDFNFISHAIEKADKNVKREIEQTSVMYDKLHLDIAAAHLEMDKELSDNFGLRQ
ncbi:Mediator complex subunit 22 [Aphelenchoides besseyi]|nr:Mediator complex subunit 22 [Aphelenchoides besseyi]